MAQEKKKGAGEIPPLRNVAIQTFYATRPACATPVPYSGADVIVAE